MPAARASGATTSRGRWSPLRALPGRSCRLSTIIVGDLRVRRAEEPRPRQRRSPPARCACLRPPGGAAATPSRARRPTRAYHRRVATPRPRATGQVMVAWQPPRSTPIDRPRSLAHRRAPAARHARAPTLRPSPAAKASRGEALPCVARAGDAAPCHGPDAALSCNGNERQRKARAGGGAAPVSALGAPTTSHAAPAALAASRALPEARRGAHVADGREPRVAGERATAPREHRARARHAERGSRARRRSPADAVAVEVRARERGAKRVVVERAADDGPVRRADVLERDAAVVPVAPERPRSGPRGSGARGRTARSTRRRRPRRPGRCRRRGPRSCRGRAGRARGRP